MQEAFKRVMCGLVVFQDLTWHQADGLADAVEFTERIDGGVALASDALEGLTLLYLVEMNLRRERC